VEQLSVLWQAADLTLKVLNTLERQSRDKRSILLDVTFIDDSKSSFKTRTPVANVIKNFRAVSYDFSL
jgi:hypothetical protein